MNLTHHFLLSMPSLANSWFEKTITYVFEHNEDGALGFVINRSAPISITEVYQQLEINISENVTLAADVLEGGPIDSQRGFILFDSREGDANPIDAPSPHFDDGGHGISLSGSTEILDHIGAGDGPDQYLLLLGYAGWAAGQLESEMAENSWLTCQADFDILFSGHSDSKFDRAAQSMGVDFSRLSSDTGHA
jgi:putative transcriptional regulator